MREYSKVAAGFYTGKTGRMLRGDAAAQSVALYLIICASSNAIGLYQVEVATICSETGLKAAQVGKALARLRAVGFAFYDGETGWVFLPEMAAHQFAPELAKNDNKVKFIAKLFALAKKSPFYVAFHERYATAFHLAPLPPCKPLGSPFVGGPKPLRGQEQEMEQDQEQEHQQVESTRGLGDRSPTRTRTYEGAREPDAFDDEEPFPLDEVA